MESTTMLDEVDQALAANRSVRVPPLAKKAGFSTGGFYALARRGDVKVIKIGKSVRVPPDEARRVLGREG
jgi:hypothetical protein